MAGQENYYESLDFKYYEIGIAMQVIDRMYPGKVVFVIPTLTPNLNTSSVQNTTIIQRDKSNIVNENKDAVDVSDIVISNALYIEIPRELTSLPGALYDITDGWLQGTSRGSVPGYIYIGGITGTIELVLNKRDRYIPIKSKWLIGFIGGDITCPVVMARLPDSAGSPVTEAPLPQAVTKYPDDDYGFDPLPDIDIE